MNLLNVSGIAAFVLYNTVYSIEKSDSSFQRKKFLIDLSDALVYDQVMRRSTNGLMESHRAILTEVKNNLTGQENQQHQRQRGQLKRPCFMCSAHINRKTKTCCMKCGKNVCGQHSVTTTQCNLCEKSVCMKTRRQIPIDFSFIFCS